MSDDSSDQEIDGYLFKASADLFSRDLLSRESDVSLL